METGDIKKELPARIPLKRKHQSQSTSANSSVPPVQRKRIKPEWKEDIKPEVASVTQVVQQLCQSILSNNLTNFHAILARFNSIYLYRLRKTEPVETVKVIIGSIQDTHNLIPYGDELIFLIKTIIERYNISDSVAGSIASTLNEKADCCYVSGSLFSLMETLLKTDKIKPFACSDALEFAKESLRKYNESCRVFAIQFLIAFLHKSDKAGQNTELCDFLLEFCNDRNPKIRRFAIEGIEKFLTLAKKVPLSYYNRFVKSCQDTDKFVRISSLRIVRMFADFFPKETVSEDRRFPLRLVDDAFTTTCHAMNDLDVDIRAEAAQLLGTFDDVSDSFLFQTLDKKLMKNMKRLADGRVATGASNEWSTGKKLGEDVPIEGNEEEGQSLIPTGTCGAFVAALEDEFKAVRQPAVYSLGKLAANRPDFANQCIDHLADMFNDEIAAVRIDAIRALTPLVTYGVLQSEQLKTLLTGLDDASQDSRVALLELLSRSNFTQTECIKDLLSRLISTLHRFPRDENFIFKCASSVGARHSHLLTDVVAEVYKLHPFLTRVEESINDQYYLVKLIMILNAASKSESICALLPAYVKMNYRFVRLTMPNIIAPIEAFDNTSIKKGVAKPMQTHNVNKIIEKEYSRLLKIQFNEDIGCRQRLYERFLRDLNFFLKVEPEYAHPCNYLHALATVMSLMDKIMNGLKNDNVPTFLDVQETLQKIYFIEFQCNQVPTSILYFLLECSTTLNVIYAGMRTLMDSKYLDATAILSDELRRAQKRLVELDAEPTLQLSSLLRFFLEANSSKALDAQTILKSVVGNTLMVEDEAVTKEFDKISIKSIKIIEPNEVKKISIMMGLPSGVAVTCVLSNFRAEDIQHFRIKVKYADDSSSYFLPPRSDFSQINENSWSLHTHVLVVVKEGIAATTTAQFFFGLFFPRFRCSSILFYDRCFGFLPSNLTSANSNGQFLALPDTDDLLKIATCSVKTEPIPVKRIS